jgi:predicted porin
MQKKIIALAVAAVFSAPVYADVNLYGVVDAAVIRASGAGQESDLIAFSGGLSSSRLGVKATEPLDNGMTAVVVLEYGLDTQTDSTIGNARQEMLAVAGDFGTVATGYLQTTGYDWASKFDPTAGSKVSPLENVTKGGGFVIGSDTVAARAPRAVAYISPSMGGVTVAVNYSTAVTALTGPDLGNLTQTADVKHSAYFVSATYEQDALAVGGVYTAVTAAGAAYATEYSVGGSYDLGAVKLLGTYQANTPDGGSASKAMSFSAVAPVGPGAVAVTFAKNTMVGVDNDASGFTAAWLQGLSKTTTFYAAYSAISQQTGTRDYSVADNGLSAASLDLGGSSSLVAVGLRKKF